MWETGSGELLGELQLENPVQTIAWSLHADKLATASFDDARVTIWDSESGTRIVDFTTTGEVSAIAWSPDGTRLATGGTSVEIWDVRSAELVGNLPGTGSVLGWSPDCKFVAADSDDDIKVIEVKGEHVVHVLSHPVGPAMKATREMRVYWLMAAWSPDGTILATANTESIRLWNTESGTLLRELPMTTDNCGPWRPFLAAVSWLDDGDSIATVTWCGAYDDRYAVWDARSGERLRWAVIPNDPRGPRTNGIGPGGRVVALGGPSYIRLFDTRNPRIYRTMLSMKDGQYAVITPAGHYRGSPGIDSELVYFVNTADGEQLTLTPEEFSRMYLWRNAPERVTPLIEKE
jgi:WD40 repeat protein